MEQQLMNIPIGPLAAPAAIEYQKFLSAIITDGDLERIQPGRFNILTAPRGRGKTTFSFDQRILNFSRAKKHIVYLVHTIVLRDNIHLRYPDITAVFADTDLDGWMAHRQQKVWTTEEDDDKIHLMCYQTFAALLRRDISWLNDIDLIVWDEFDDIQQYYDAEIKAVKKQFPDLKPERLASLLQEGRHTSIVAFIYAIHNIILKPARIRLLAMSATPEIAAALFGDYVNYIMRGKIDEIYDARETIFIQSVAAAVAEKLICPSKHMCPWIYTERVTDIFVLAELMTANGFNVLMLWSFDNNTNWRGFVTQEQRDALQYINETHLVPPQYDCVITNQVAGRGIDIYDTRFQDWICNSRNYTDIGQFIRARYAPERKYILSAAKMLVEFVREDGHFSACYYTWHNKDEIKELLQTYVVYDKTFTKQLLTWQAVTKEWGDEIEFEERKYGRAHIKQYRIVGLKKAS